MTTPRREGEERYVIAWGRIAVILAVFAPFLVWGLLLDESAKAPEVTSTVESTVATVPPPVTPYVPTAPPVVSWFHGYPCTEDCSGHQAGYDWAEENEIGDPSECDGNSVSFNEGCEAYVEQMQKELDREIEELEQDLEREAYRGL